MEARKSVLKLTLITFGMFGFGFALVPIYDIFCDITGLNGKVTGPTYYFLR
jgi:cytochrome c oxidase assembly protein subunit 11